MNKFNKKKLALAGTMTSVLLQFQTTVLATDAESVKSKLNDGLTTIQGILSALVVGVGICVSLWIIIKRMPDADNPHEKSQVYRSVGNVWGLVALGAAAIWLVPFFYSLLQ